tara:strand:- start:58594 stop:59319 length:726 start_codon:yes stop_codon:yes gene_type:complete
LTYVEKVNPNKTEHGIIRTADDASYVQPPMNLKNRGTWKDNSAGNSSYYQRPPGYGMLYLASSHLYPSNPYVVIKTIQILGFFVSILLVFKLLIQYGLNQKWALVATGLYAFLPNFSGFIYHSITEGITPVLLLWSIYEWTKLLQVNQGSSQVISFRCFLSNGFLLLVRPQLIVFVIVFIVYLLTQAKNQIGRFKSTYIFAVHNVASPCDEHFRINGNASNLFVYEPFILQATARSAWEFV